jgi:predicted Zn-dependent peptidase
MLDTTLNLKTAEEIKEQLDTLSEVLSEKVYQYRLLEESKKILLSEINCITSKE